MLDFLPKFAFECVLEFSLEEARHALLSRRSFE